MPIKFYTKNINTRLYSRAIRYYLWQTFRWKMQYRNFLRKWTIEIYSSDRASEDSHFDGKDGVGGVTGQGLVKLYLEDKKTLLGDLFQRVIRKNMVPISHELCHAVLIDLGKSQKVALRNDDWGGNKKGTMLNFSTAEVHDRHIEGKFWAFRFWFWDWYKLIARRFYTKVLDIRDLT